MHDTVIIGTGISGLTAAIYAERKRMDYVLLGDEFGGQLLATGEILNYTGLKETTGLDFQKALKEQIEFNGVKPRKERATSIERKGDDFTVTTDKGTYDARTVIIATGARARKLGVPGEERLANKGVAYCPICDGPLFSGMDIAIIGGGNSALEGVDFMKGIAKKIYVFTNEGSFRAHEYLQERIEKDPDVTPIFNARIKEIQGEKFVSGIRYETDGEEKTIPLGAVIVQIGREPNTSEFSQVIDLEDDGHIIIDCQTRTSVCGIFACGDCASGHEYQYIIAAGQGCMALLKASRYLARKEDICHTGE